MINLSFIKLKGDVKDSYELTLRNWKNKMVNWCDLHKVMGNSSIQYSPFIFRNGYKTPFNMDRSKQDCICIDVDNGYPIHKFQKTYSKYQFILATTKSNMKPKKGIVCERYRVLFKAHNISEDVDVFFRAMELCFPMNDIQVLTKTQAFLGYSKAIVANNEGKSFDMYKANSLAIQQLKAEEDEREADRISKANMADYMQFNGMSTVEVIKEQLDRETVRDILESIGIEFDSTGKCKIREDEATHSCKVFEDGGLYDYGSSDKIDVFSVLMDKQEMTFSQALRYVQQYI